MGNLKPVLAGLGMAILAAVAANLGRAADRDQVALAPGPGQVAVTIGGEPVATYFYHDPSGRILRPYFAHVHAPGGVQVTRNHPPIEGEDPTDHGTYHPGIWLAFGDISGSDYWRNKARVEHVGFTAAPAGGPGRGSFAVHNRYLAGVEAGQAVCEEHCRYTFYVRPAGYLVVWDSTFSSAREFYFGDQEEMGLGFRVASPIRVKGGGNGTIMDAKGRRNEAEVWGNASDWCDYSGRSAGQHVGMTIMCHPGNFRPSWFHARDYGLLLANAFGRKAFGKGPTSKVTVKPGASLRLRYAILLHAGAADSQPDLKAAYADYLRLAGR